MGTVLPSFGASSPEAADIGGRRELFIDNALVERISGLELEVGAEGKTQPNYLKDFCRNRPGVTWEKLPDMPWSACAAPWPEPVVTAPAFQVEDRWIIVSGKHRAGKHTAVVRS